MNFERKVRESMKRTLKNEPNVYVRRNNNLQNVKDRKYADPTFLSSLIKPTTVPLHRLYLSAEA